MNTQGNAPPARRPATVYSETQMELVRVLE